MGDGEVEVYGYGVGRLEEEARKLRSKDSLARPR